MKRRIVEYGLLTVAAAIIAGFLSIVLTDGSPRPSASNASALVSRRSAIRQTNRASRIERRISPAPNGLISGISAVGVSNQLVRAAADADEALFEKVVAELLDAIELATKGGDSQRVVALIEKLRSLSQGLSLAKGGFGGAAKRRILAALEGAGPAGLDQVLDFVGDADPDVSALATKMVLDSLNDIELGDYRRAEIVVAAAGEITDETALVRLFQEFIKMRPSVGVQTLMEISNSGTAEAKNHLGRTISAFTSDPDITTVEQLPQWFEDRGGDPADTRPFEPIILEKPTGGK